jgi:hypothetical protein
MLGQNQGMGRRFVILAHSNYPFYRKTSGRWDKFLKPTLLTPTTIPPPKYGRIYYLLSRPPKNCKHYEVTINDYST